MLLRLALLAMVAFTMIGGGTLAWVLLVAPSGPVAVAAPTVKALVLVAALSLRAGVLIKPEELDAQEVMRDDLPAGATLDTPQGRSSLNGAMVLRSLGKGQVILPADVVHPGDHGFLAAVLAPRMRAVTVSVDAVSGTAGLIWPGDRIDLILTQALDDPTLAAGRRVAAETVLLGARVIAVDQQIVQGQAPDGTVPPANRTATLEVTPGQAERVLVAGHLGKLSLSVLPADRPASSATAELATRPGATSPSSSSAAAHPAEASASNEQSSGSNVTWAGDVSPALDSGGHRSAPVMVHVFEGGLDSKEFHF